MKGARTPVGYTIVEVMIVLAVSGVMFLIAANFINGKQEATSFPQGVNGLASNIQNTIEQVTDGQYSDIDFTCTFSYGDSNVSITNSGGQTTGNSANNIGEDTQGTQSTCIFLGKVIQFNESGGVGGGIPSQQQYETFTLAGGRLNNNQEPIGLDTTNPTTPLDNDAPTPISPQLTVQSSIPQSLNVIGMHLENVNSEPTTYGGTFPSGISNNFAMGFIQNLGTAGNPGTQNGAQQISLYYVNSFTGVESSSVAPGLINGSSLVPVPTGQEIVLCVTDYKRYAYVEVGSANNQLEVKVRMLGTSQCT